MDGPSPLSLPGRVARRAHAELKRLRHHLDVKRHARRARPVERGRPPEYHAYVETQLDRSLSRRENDPGVGQRILVDSAASIAPPNAAVLCVGCRNGLELEAFRAKGIGDVRGIDLFSQRPDVLVMDMHDMSFADDSFDIVYTSHSLEHAFDVDQAVREMVRVARPSAVIAVEVPIAHKGSAADLVVFDGIEMLERVFGDAVGDVLLREEEPARSARNDQGSTVARLVFRLPRSAQIAATTKPGTTGSA